MFYFLQKESLSDVQLHLASMRGDVGVLKKILDSGKVHVDCKDKVSNGNLLITPQKCKRVVTEIVWKSESKKNK